MRWRGVPASVRGARLLLIYDTNVRDTDHPDANGAEYKPITRCGLFGKPGSCAWANAVFVPALGGTKHERGFAASVAADDEHQVWGKRLDFRCWTHSTADSPAGVHRSNAGRDQPMEECSCTASGLQRNATAPSCGGRAANSGRSRKGPGRPSCCTRETDFTAFDSGTSDGLIEVGASGCVVIMRKHAVDLPRIDAPQR